MDDTLRQYLAAQESAVSGSDEEPPQPDDDPTPTDRDPDEETPDDGAPGGSEGEEGDDDQDEDEEDEEETPPPPPNPELVAVHERLAAIERERDESRTQLEQFKAQQATQAEWNRLQTRWAAMDEDEAAKEKAELVRVLQQQDVERKFQALAQERDQLAARIQYDEDLRTHKPKAIAFLTEAHNLTPRQTAHLERYDDALVMKTVAEAFAVDNKAAEREARKQARIERRSSGKDQIGSSQSGPTPTAPQPQRTGKFGSLLDYLAEQKEQTSHGSMAAPRRA